MAGTDRDRNSVIVFGQDRATLRHGVEARPEQVSDRLGGECRDPGLERFEIVGQSVPFLTGSNLADSLELERDLAFGLMGAENMEDRGSGQDSQFDPDG
jgi:hypothetical protein